MTVTRLEMRRVEKVWGRQDLPSAFGAGAATDPVGEIWYEDPRGTRPALLIKYLFTSERLSIQVHPDDAASRAAGHPCGKDEAWVVLAADEDATIGIGLCEPVEREALRAAALDGRIVRMLDWKPAKAGDTYYSPAGTVHALGAGLMLVEVQQNVDVTYRLYDYGRPRELHLEEAMSVADLRPYEPPCTPYEQAPGRQIVAHGSAFVLERWTSGAAGMLAASSERPAWVVPVAGGGHLGAEQIGAGGVWLAEAPAPIRMEPGSDLLIAYPGASVIDALVR